MVECWFLDGGFSALKKCHFFEIYFFEIPILGSRLKLTGVYVYGSGPSGGSGRTSLSSAFTMDEARPRTRAEGQET